MIQQFSLRTWKWLTHLRLVICPTRWVSALNLKSKYQRSNYVGSQGQLRQRGFQSPLKGCSDSFSSKNVHIKMYSIFNRNKHVLAGGVCVFIIKRGPCNIAWPYFCSHLKWIQNRETEQALPSPQHFRCEPRHLFIGMEALLLAEFLQPQFPNVDAGLHSVLLKFSLTHRISSCVVRCSRHRL